MLAAKLEDGVCGVDRDDLEQEAGGGQIGDGGAWAAVAADGVDRPALAEREKGTPQQQVAQQRVPAVEHQRVPGVQRDEQDERGHRREAGPVADEEAGCGDAGEAEEDRLGERRAPEGVQRQGTERRRDRRQRRPREDAGVGVEGDEVTRAEGEVGEQEGAEGDPEGGERAGVDADPPPDGSGNRPEACGRRH